MVYVQIILLWRYFILEITFGHEKEFQDVVWPSPTVRFNLIFKLTLNKDKIGPYSCLMPQSNRTSMYVHQGYTIMYQKLT